MRRHLRDLPPLAVPEGYGLRHFRPDDAAVWAALLAGNGELGTWSIERAQPYFAPNSPMPLEGAFFATFGDVPVATAQMHRDEPIPELGWVAANPLHRGHGLGRLVCLAVLHYAANLGHEGIYLKTDDHRLPAIRSYLRLGFQPSAGEEERWAAVLSALGRP